MIQKSQLVTHNGSFHAEQVTVLALLAVYKVVNYDQLEIIRTRNLALINQADIFLDVSGIDEI
ncbi:MAG: uncharacterized UPF0160 family protein [Psychromonas sp.]|jgi:uncharacterized UPF0160 family protein